MGIIQRLESASADIIPCPVAKEAATILQEIRGYLVAASEGSMSSNNSEQLASELLDRVDA